MPRTFAQTQKDLLHLGEKQFKSDDLLERDAAVDNMMAFKEKHPKSLKIYTDEEHDQLAEKRYFHNEGGKLIKIDHRNKDAKPLIVPKMRTYRTLTLLAMEKGHLSPKAIYNYLSEKYVVSQQFITLQLKASVRIVEESLGQKEAEQIQPQADVAPVAAAVPEPETVASPEHTGRQPNNAFRLTNGGNGDQPPAQMVTVGNNVLPGLDVSTVLASAVKENPNALQGVNIQFIAHQDSRSGGDSGPNIEALANQVLGKLNTLEEGQEDLKEGQDESLQIAKSNKENIGAVKAMTTAQKPPASATKEGGFDYGGGVPRPSTRESNRPNNLFGSDADDDDISSASAENSADLKKLTVPELKEKLKAKGLKVSGKKADLIDRLLG